MINNKTISLVIPAKNEEKNIKQTIASAPSCIDEFIVVDNGSTDNTAKAAQEAGAVVISEPRKMNGVGYGYAHITGLAAAKGDFVFAADADDTYPLYEIENIVTFMEEASTDFVSCSRLPLENKEAISRTRRLGIHVLNIEVMLLYQTPIRDILSGMWGVRKSVIPLLDLRMGDWNLSPEIKISALVDNNVQFAEYPIDHFAREHEPSKQQIFKTGFGHLFYILKRRFTQDFNLGFAIRPILRPAFS